MHSLNGYIQYFMGVCLPVGPAAESPEAFWGGDSWPGSEVERETGQYILI